MKTKEHNPQLLTIQEGYFMAQTYSDYKIMAQSAENWEHNCTYQLLPSALNGEHKVLQLHSIQLSYATRAGGMMNEVSSAKDTISIAVIEENADKTCFDRIKLSAGDILFFDDSRPFSFMSNAAIKFSVITVPKNTMDLKLPLFTKALNCTIKDTNSLLSRALHQTWDEFTQDSDTNLLDFKEKEKKLCEIIVTLLQEQVPVEPKLTTGETIALQIRDQVYHHMDGKISIESLAKQYNVSEKTLQNSFKSLFGFTPKYFLRQLKLNLVHNDLKHEDANLTSVAKIAIKWGFAHMGHFGKYYTELFDENPSQTLKRGSMAGRSIKNTCISRQEEILS